MSVVVCGLVTLVATLPPVVRLEGHRLEATCMTADLIWQIHRVNGGSRPHIDKELAAVRRLAELQRHWNRTPAGRVAAAREWWVRAREMELDWHSVLHCRLESAITELELYSHRLDAELELLQALSALPPGGPAVLAPFTPAPADFRATVSDVSLGEVRFVVPATSRLQRFDRLTVSRPGGAVIELAVLDVARPWQPVAVPTPHVGSPLVAGVWPLVAERTAAAVPLPAGGRLPEVRVGDRLRP